MLSTMIKDYCQQLIIISGHVVCKSENSKKNTFLFQNVHYANIPTFLKNKRPDFKQKANKDHPRQYWPGDKRQDKKN